MKAIVYKKYGSPDVFEFTDVEKPQPKEGQVLVKVYASTVTPADWRMRGLIVPLWFRLPARIAFGFSRPKFPILGSEVSGEVVAVGSGVKQYKVGDKVYALTAGMNMGGYAEYVCLDAAGMMAPTPAIMNYQEAAAVPMGAHTALYFLQKAKIKSGQKVLIYGASGSIGTFSVQLAKYFGAEVTAVCSGANLEMVKSLGADHVIDYTKEDFSKRGEQYDVIFDTLGKTSFSRSKRSLTKRGRYLLAMFGMRHLFGKMWLGLTSRRRVIIGEASEDKESLFFLKEIIEQGKLRTVIDRTYPLAQTAEAHRYAQQGHKKGNVIIVIGDAE